MENLFREIKNQKNEFYIYSNMAVTIVDTTKILFQSTVNTESGMIAFSSISENSLPDCTFLEKKELYELLFKETYDLKNSPDVNYLRGLSYSIQQVPVDVIIIDKRSSSCLLYSAEIPLKIEIYTKTKTENNITENELYVSFNGKEERIDETYIHYETRKIMRERMISFYYYFWSSKTGRCRCIDSRISESILKNIIINGIWEFLSDKDFSEKERKRAEIQKLIDSLKEQLEQID
jgi:hypothetical protein